MWGVTTTLLLALLAVPSAALLATQHSLHAPTPAPKLRGGVGNVDPVLVAKIATGLELAHSSFTVLAPEKAGEVSPFLQGS